LLSKRHDLIVMALFVCRPVTRGIGQSGLPGILADGSLRKDPEEATEKLCGQGRIPFAPKWPAAGANHNAVFLKLRPTEAAFPLLGEEMWIDGAAKQGWFVQGNNGKDCRSRERCGLFPG
jgi:hypothetical protein